MSYLISIKTAILIFPITSLLFTIPFILNQYHKYGAINKFRVFIIYSFILYMIVIYFLVILPLPSKSSVLKKPNMIRLIPFSFIGDFLNESSLILTNPKTYLQSLKEPCFYTVIFNIFMTIPFGMYLRYYYKCSLKKIIIISFLLSLFFEITQLTGLYFIYPYPYRIFDVDDLIMNTLGGVIGYFIMGIFNNYLPSREKIDSDSIEEGKKVSGLRRITIFYLDILIYIFISIFLGIFYGYNNIKYIIFIVYFVIIPYITKGKTLGSSFLNVKIEYQKNILICTIFRSIFIYSYYFLLPYVFIYIIGNTSDYLNLTTKESIYLYMITFIIILVFYLSHFLIILIKRRIYYDNLFKTKYISTTIGK